MAGDDRDHSRSGVLHELASLGGRAAATTFRPLTTAIGATFEAGVGLERRAVDRALNSRELDLILSSALESARLQAAVGRAFDSDAARRLVDSFFDSSLFDRVVDRLLVSDALWRLIDEIADSPSVTAAISQQGLGFADQVGDEMRARSRKADDWLERAARRVGHRRPEPIAVEPDASTR